MLPTSSEPSMQTFMCHSRSHQYNGNKTPDLQLTLREYGQDSIEIELKNLQYSAQKQQKIKHILLLLLVYAAYSFSTANASIVVNGHVLCDISLLLWLLYRCINLFSLIQTETVLFCLDLALQYHTVRFLHRPSNMFIPANKIYDLVINEVIENVRKPLDVHYILIVRTQGDLFQKKPIITLFNTMSPSFECLQQVYNCLNKRMRNSSTPS